MKYVKLTAKSDSWYVEGTEVWDYDEDIRVTKDEWEECNGFIICVRGVRKCDPEFSYEKQYMKENNVKFRIDGECCGCNEFEVEYTNDNGKSVIAMLQTYEGITS